MDYCVPMTTTQSTTVGMFMSMNGTVHTNQACASGRKGLAMSINAELAATLGSNPKMCGRCAA